MTEPPDKATCLPPPGAPDAVYIVDISGYLFRAYHALPPLHSPKGEPTHAVLGVTTMLLKLIDEHAPVRLWIALDSPGRSFRKELYDGYKINRSAAPEDLKHQLARLQEIIAAYGFPTFAQPGVEADDVIASLTRQARAEGRQVVIVSSDKDLLQLVGDGVCMYDTARNVVYGVAETERKLGVPPARVRDFLALTGDSSDNIPGVPSVGPKTAAQLLTEHGDLDAIYAQLDAIKRKALQKKLADHRQQAYLSRELVSLKDDLVLDVAQQEASRPPPDRPRLYALFSELAFTRLLAQVSPEVEAEAAPPPPAPRERPCRVVLDEAGLEALVRAAGEAPRLAWMCACEGGHAVSGSLVGVGLSTGDAAFYVPLSHSYLGCPDQLATEIVISRLRPLLEDGEKEKLCAESKREMLWMLRHGVELRGVVFDAALASYLRDPERHAHRLQDIARFELEQDVAQSAPLLERSPAPGAISQRPVEEAGRMIGELLDVVERAERVIAPRLDEAGARLLRDMELPLSRVLAGMEQTGVRVDTQHLTRISQRIAEQLVALEARCKELAGHEFNVGSPRQLEAILFDELGLPVIKRTKTARSTDQSVLEDLALQHELPAVILEHRMLAKLKSTYLDALPREVNPRTQRIHTDFRQTVAATGRLSSSDPNLQNIPIRSEVGRSIREAFIAREGWSILSVDYSQIELRVLAHLSHDPVLMEAFREGTDVHVRTALAIFGVEEAGVTREMRAQAKTVNFAVIYGQTQFALARNLRIPRAEAGRYIKAFFAEYAGVQRYMDRVVEEGRERGYVTTLCGRVRHLPDLRSANRVQRQAAERIARNTPIQGTSADIIKLAMIAIQREIDARALHSRMLLTVHDELVFEAPPEERATLEALVCERMEHALALDVPLVVDKGWGRSWGEAH